MLHKIWITNSYVSFEEVTNKPTRLFQQVFHLPRQEQHNLHYFQEHEYV